MDAGRKNNQIVVKAGGKFFQDAGIEKAGRAVDAAVVAHDIERDSGIGIRIRASGQPDDAFDGVNAGGKQARGVALGQLSQLFL